MQAFAALRPGLGALCVLCTGDKRKSSLTVSSDFDLNSACVVKTNLFSKKACQKTRLVFLAHAQAVQTFCNTD
jgi:hypothetical protein